MPAPAPRRSPDSAQALIPTAKALVLSFAAIESVLPKRAAGPAVLCAGPDDQVEGWPAAPTPCICAESPSPYRSEPGPHRATPGWRAPQGAELCDASRSILW
jgi:hypothetical protein